MSDPTTWMTRRTVFGLLSYLVSLLLLLLGSFVVLYAADAWSSFGFVLVLLVPFSLGFAVGYSGPVPPLLSGIIAVLSFGVVLLFGVSLGVAGLVCAAVLLAIVVLPLIAGAILAVSARRFLEKRSRRPGAPTTLSILLLANLGLLYGESLLPRTFDPEKIETVQVLDLPAREVWSRFLFYEDWGQERPFLLKVGFPRPLFTVGQVSGPGDKKKCVYEKGYLVKEIQSYIPTRELTFDVIEQVGIEDRSIRLLDGSFRLDPLGPGRTRVTLVTRYVPKLQARVFWRPWERRVTRFLHQHILNGIEARRAGRPSPVWGLDP